MYWSEVSADRIRAHVEKIVNDIPHRAAGSANGKRMAEYSRDAMKAAGLTDVACTSCRRSCRFPSMRNFVSKRRSRSRSRRTRSATACHTPPDGIRGELIDVGSGAFNDYEGKDARGKITLSELSYTRRGTRSSASPA